MIDGHPSGCCSNPPSSSDQQHHNRCFFIEVLWTHLNPILRNQPQHLTTNHHSYTNPIKTFPTSRSTKSMKTNPYKHNFSSNPSEMTSILRRMFQPSETKLKSTSSFRSQPSQICQPQHMVPTQRSCLWSHFIRSNPTLVKTIQGSRTTSNLPTTSFRCA